MHKLMLAAAVAGALILGSGTSAEAAYGYKGFYGGGYYGASAKYGKYAYGGYGRGYGSKYGGYGRYGYYGKFR